MFRKAFSAALLGAAALATTLPAQAQSDRVQVGQLSCSLSAGIGMVVGSQRNINCTFQPDNGPPEAYTGTMTKIGLDVGFTTGSAIVWAVFAGTNRYSGMLTGTYSGAQAEATAGAGVGANVLIGGSGRSVALQPLSVQGQIGLDVAAGIGSLELHLSQ
ncbi:MAG: DUF992 domain-containing protein [Xanthobacteraceae bacterium]|jgi:hypothetical protein